MHWNDRSRDRYSCVIRSTFEALACPPHVGMLAHRIGFNLRRTLELEIATSEMATNILRHGVRGSIHAEIVLEPSPGILLIAEDEGPGFDDIEHARRDGVSRGRVLSEEVHPAHRESLGTGLGAIERLMDSVEITNAENGGSRIVAFKAAKR